MRWDALSITFGGILEVVSCAFEFDVGNAYDVIRILKQNPPPQKKKNKKNNWQQLSYWDSLDWWWLLEGPTKYISILLYFNIWASTALGKWIYWTIFIRQWSWALLSLQHKIPSSCIRTTMWISHSVMMPSRLLLQHLSDFLHSGLLCRFMVSGIVSVYKTHGALWALVQLSKLWEIRAIQTWLGKWCSAFMLYKTHILTSQCGADNLFRMLPQYVGCSPMAGKSPLHQTWSSAWCWNWPQPQL